MRKGPYYTEDILVEKRADKRVIAIWKCLKKIYEFNADSLFYETKCDNI